jgi:hypothetical protein
MISPSPSPNTLKFAIFGIGLFRRCRDLAVNEDTLPFSSQEFIEKATSIVQSGQEQGIILRIMGAVAFRVHSPALADLHKRLNRLNSSGSDFTDLDLMTYGKLNQKLEPFFRSLGYPADENAKYSIHMWAQRHFYHDASARFKIDVFFDKLEMSHTIDFKNRLEMDSPTIPLAELLLEKMQIVQINEKDIKDAVILLLGHEIGNDDHDHINGKYIASLLASDWGLTYTTITNLDKVRVFSKQCEQLSEAEKGTILSRIDSLTKQIDEEPKGTRWKVRARVGTKRKWYRDVEDRYGSE